LSNRTYSSENGAHAVREAFSEEYVLLQTPENAAPLKILLLRNTPIEKIKFLGIARHRFKFQNLVLVELVPRTFGVWIWWILRVQHF